jgi:hypothetical protein
VADAGANHALAHVQRVHLADGAAVGAHGACGDQATVTFVVERHPGDHAQVARFEQLRPAARAPLGRELIEVALRE